ncbi:MAG: NosD domain-containing protein [Promethearchaeota archaeon]
MVLESPPQQAFSLPITIDGNTELDNYCNASQDGSVSNPYIIENLTINSSSQIGISIQNTDKHLIIQNCTIFDDASNNVDEGIYLFSVVNITIRQNTIYNKYFGIQVEGLSEFNNISQNSFTDNKWGIHMYTYGGSDANLIEFNLFEGRYSGILSQGGKNVYQNNSFNMLSLGFYVGSDDGNTIANNSFIDCGFEFSDISTTNTFYNNSINSQSLLLYENQADLIINNVSNVAQVVLLDCSNITISNMTLVDNSIGIQIIRSSNCELSDNTIEDMRKESIKVVYDSENNTVIRNSITNGSFAGIFNGYDSHHNIIQENFVYDSSKGVSVIQGDCKNVSIINNTLIKNNMEGISLYNAENCTILNNSITESTNGISLGFGNSNNSIEANDISNTNYGFSISSDASNNTIWNNFIRNSAFSHVNDQTNIYNNWSYNSTGNYWDDYIEKYPNATTDGRIWNTPYEISSNIFDDYPLFKDFDFPQWLHPIYDLNFNQNENIYYDFNATDSISIDTYWLNDTTHFEISTDGILTSTVNSTVLNSIRLFNLTVYVNDTVGHAISASFQISILDDEVFPTWEHSIDNQIIFFGESFYYDLNASDNIGIAGYYIFDTNAFEIDLDGKITNSTSLNIGNYTFSVLATDYDGNNISESITVSVIRSPTNNVWISISGTEYLECFDANEIVWFTVVVKTNAPTQIMLTYNLNNPTLRLINESVTNIGYYSVDILDVSHIDLIEINFYYFDHFEEPQEQYLKLYHFQENWTALNADLNNEAKSFTIFLDSEELQTSNYFTIGFTGDAADDPSSSLFENIPGFPVSSIFLFITLGILGIFIKNKKQIR